MKVTIKPLPKTANEPVPGLVFRSKLNNDTYMVVGIAHNVMSRAPADNVYAVRLGSGRVTPEVTLWTIRWPGHDIEILGLAKNITIEVQP